MAEVPLTKGMYDNQNSGANGQEGIQIEATEASSKGRNQSNCQ